MTPGRHSESSSPSLASQLPPESRAHARYTATHTRSYRQSLLSSPLLLRVSFYRLYEFFIIDWNAQHRNELEYFCCSACGHADWAVSSILDPSGDAEPVRCAVLAALKQLICAAFNRRIVVGFVPGSTHYPS